MLDGGACGVATLRCDVPPGRDLDSAPGRERETMRVLRVAILGQGRSGRDIHGAHLSKDSERYRIAAVVDPLEERRTRAEKEYGCDTYPDHRALFERED